MSLARFWRDQGKVQQARELLGSGLRLVHGGVRHARSEGGEGAAGGVGGVIIEPSIGPVSRKPKQAQRSRYLQWDRQRQ